ASWQAYPDGRAEPAIAGRPWADKTRTSARSGPASIARLRHTSTTSRRALHRRDRNPPFHRYDQLPASPHAGDLLQETGRNPSAIVWASRHRPAPAGYPAARIHRCAVPLIGAAWGD